MGKGFQTTEHIASSMEDVWTCLTDWKRAPEWMRGIENMHPLAEGPVGEGTRLAFRSRGTGRETTIVVWSPPRRLALRSQQGGMTAIYEYSCEPENNGTRLTLRARCDAQGIGWRLASPLIGILMKRADSGQVTALKRLIESPAESAS